VLPQTGQSLVQQHWPLSTEENRLCDGRTDAAPAPATPQTAVARGSGLRRKERQKAALCCEEGDVMSHKTRS